MTINLAKDKKYNVTLRCGGKVGPIAWGQIAWDHAWSMTVGGTMFAWRRDGTCIGNQVQHPFDIVAAEEVPEPKVIEGWINIYASNSYGEIYETRARADTYSTFGRIACIKIRVTEGEGLTP